MMTPQEFLQKAERIILSLPIRVDNSPKVAENRFPQKEIITAKQAREINIQTYLKVGGNYTKHYEMRKFKLIYIVFGILTIACNNTNKSNRYETSLATEVVKERTVTTTCNCFDGIGSREGDTSIFVMKFSNGESISVCGFVDKEMEEKTISEFNVFECSTGKSLTEYDAMQICRLIEKKDSLVIQELKYLPTGKNWTWNLIQIGEQIITVNDRKIFATPLTPKLEKLYIDDQQGELFLNSLHQGTEHTSDWELVLGKLEVLALAGNEKARYILDNYENFTGQETDGAVRETWSDAKATVEWIKK